jgi:hypothetical protein
MTEKLYLTIDSSQLELQSAANFELPLAHYDSEKYTRIVLKQIFLQHETDIRRLFRSNGKLRPILVHCSLLNKDDNFLNGQKSDVIGIVYPEVKPRRTVSEKFVGSSSKLVKYDSKIGMSLATSDGVTLDDKGNFSVIYELEFSLL